MLRYAAMESRLLRRRGQNAVQDRGFRTRQKVLDAARKIVVRRGYDAVRVAEIANLAEVGYGTFYKYFRSKKDVFEAIFEEIWCELAEAGLPTQMEVSRLEDQLRTGISNFLRAYYKNREVILALEPAYLSNAEIRKTLAEIREHEVQHMAREFRQLDSQGWKIQGNPEILSLAMLQAMNCVAQDWITRRRHLALEEVTNTLCEIWFRALLPSRPPVHQPQGSSIPTGTTDTVAVARAGSG